jgi:hypothetical protein
MPRSGKQVQLMRQDGYVTAAEVAEATGHALPTVHAGIKDGRVPGQRFGWGWYVDIHKYAAIVATQYPPDSVVIKNIAALKLLVDKPASGKAPRRTA